MKMRPMLLPRGWYPGTKDEAEAYFARFEESSGAEPSRSAKAAISPHAGWYYSGAYAYSAFRSLAEEADCLVIFGGHRPAGSPPLAAFEGRFDTPLGPVAADGELREAIGSRIDLEEDLYRDNTVEVLLPLAKKFFPESGLLWLRVPNDASSLEIGELVAEKAAALGRRAVAVASTDLTHYGQDYGFSPRGIGTGALKWVREENDKAIVDAFLAMDGREALRLGEERQAACSAGAAAAAIAFALGSGCADARLLGYGTSADRQGEAAPEQFVGYAAVSYGPRSL